MDNLLTEEIMKRRLLIDGDGAGDDRKVGALTKAYVTWASDPKDLCLRPLQAHLRQIQQGMVRTVEGIGVSYEGTVGLRGVKGAVGEEVEETRGAIGGLKGALEEATTHRKHSMEYHALAKLIHTKHDRQATHARRQALTHQLHSLRGREGSLERKLEDRKGNLSMMSSTVERLKELLAEEDPPRPHSPLPMQIGGASPVPDEPESPAPAHKYEDLSESEPGGDDDTLMHDIE